MPSSFKLTVEEAAWLAVHDAGRLSGPNVEIGMPENIRAALLRKGRITNDAPQSAARPVVGVATPPASPAAARAPVFMVAVDLSRDACSAPGDEPI